MQEFLLRNYKEIYKIKSNFYHALRAFSKKCLTWLSVQSKIILSMALIKETHGKRREYKYEMGEISN